jgi:D-alanine-D-alanine ligase
VLEVISTDKASAHGYGYENKEHFEEKMIYRLVDDEAANDAAEVALSAWRALRCRDGGRVDIRFGNDGKAYFLEVNPLAGLNPDRSDLVFITRLRGLSYRDLIERILASFLRRNPRLAAALE